MPHTEGMIMTHDRAPKISLEKVPCSICLTPTGTPPALEIDPLCEQCARLMDMGYSVETILRIRAHQERIAYFEIDDSMF